MADGNIYPSKPNGATAATKAAHLYNPTRPLYRGQPTRRRSSHSCFRRCCCCTFLILIFLLLLAAAAIAIIWTIFRPHAPTFKLDSLKVSSLSVTPASKITCKLTLTLTARNPNKEIAFTYDQANINVLTAEKDVVIGTGVVPGFLHEKKNVTDLRVVIGNEGKSTVGDEEDVKVVKMGLKSSKGLALKVSLDSKVKGTMWSLKSPWIPVKVVCEGIRVKEEGGKKKKVVSDVSDGVNCKVDVRVKIWRWTF